MLQRLGSKELGPQQPSLAGAPVEWDMEVDMEWESWRTATQQREPELGVWLVLSTFLVQEDDKTQARKVSRWVLLWKERNKPAVMSPPTGNSSLRFPQDWKVYSGDLIKRGFMEQSRPGIQMDRG
jgi:hypothetical protein